MNMSDSVWNIDDMDAPCWKVKAGTAPPQKKPLIEIKLQHTRTMICLLGWPCKSWMWSDVRTSMVMVRGAAARDWSHRAIDFLKSGESGVVAVLTHRSSWSSWSSCHTSRSVWNINRESILKQHLIVQLICLGSIIKTVNKKYTIFPMHSETSWHLESCHLFQRRTRDDVVM